MHVRAYGIISMTDGQNDSQHRIYENAGRDQVSAYITSSERVLCLFIIIQKKF